LDAGGVGSLVELDSKFVLTDIDTIEPYNEHRSKILIFNIVKFKNVIDIRATNRDIIILQQIYAKVVCSLLDIVVIERGSVKREHKRKKK
jgi:hypothetical protein